MNRLQVTFRAFLFVAIILALSSLAQAQAVRTWVSGVGDDANPCSRTAPCKTLAGAISKTARGGEIDALDPDGFGAVTITKSITIDATGTMGSVLAAATGTNGFVINITDIADSAKSVRLRGISINGGGVGQNGISVVAVNALSIENCIIDGFTTAGINVAAAKGKVFVSNSTIRNNGAGIAVDTGPPVQVAIANVNLLFNGTALAGTITQFGTNVLFGNTVNKPRPPPRPLGPPSE